MEKLYFLLLSFFSVSVGSYANDTLSRSQIYNFNVGDTFQFRYSMENIDMGIPLTISYGRKVLMQKTFSTNLDTIYFGYGSPGGSISQWETITNLDSFLILQIPNIDTSCAMLYSFDTTTYTGYASNGLQINCFESGESYRYTKGLGRTLYGSGHVGQIGYGTDASSEELIYYSNGITHVGTPYIPPPPFPVYYEPLPETCAVWTRTVYGSYNFTGSWGNITEQIRTGNKILKGGKTYVELICRIQNDITHQFTPDSLIGYFYNDVAAQSARFVTDTTATATGYSINTSSGQPGGQCSYNGYYFMDSVLIGGVLRTYWGCSGSGNDISDAKISGIGRLNGLIRVSYLRNSYGREAGGDLTCFCVCGQKLYPSNTANTCDLLSDIPQPELLNPQFTISPNPATNQLIIDANDIQLAEINIYDITGGLVSQTRQPFNKYIDISQLVGGVYIAEMKTKSVCLRRRWVKM